MCFQSWLYRWKILRCREVQWLARKRQSCDLNTGLTKEHALAHEVKSKVPERKKSICMLPVLSACPCFSSPSRMTILLTYWPGTDSEAENASPFHIYYLGHEIGLGLELGSDRIMVPCQHNYILCTLWSKWLSQEVLLCVGPHSNWLPKRPPRVVLAWWIYHRAEPISQPSQCSEVCLPREDWLSAIQLIGDWSIKPDTHILINN